MKARVFLLLMGLFGLSASSIAHAQIKPGYWFAKEFGGDAWVDPKYDNYHLKKIFLEIWNISSAGKGRTRSVLDTAETFGFFTKALEDKGYEVVKGTERSSADASLLVKYTFMTGAPASMPGEKSQGYDYNLSGNVQLVPKGTRKTIYKCSGQTVSVLREKERGNPLIVENPREEFCKIIDKLPHTH